MVVVTGGGRGIGAGIAALAATNGAEVRVLDLDCDFADESYASLPLSERCRIEFIRCDVSNRADVDHTAERLAREGTRLSLWVNNAGIVQTAGLSEIDVEMFHQILDVNLLGAIFGSRAAAALMRPHRAGSIINISSMTAQRPLPGRLLYGSSKAALGHATRSIAKELAPDHITVNAIAPVSTETALLNAAYPDEGSRRRRMDAIPLGRFCQPRDIANMALYIGCPRASFITGQLIMIDGGASL
ncbi:MAG: glucose 1-dehydrogenase [Hyphomicrobiales bacterium]|nr:glucose 1-dehydrogenase [Hyphomicrobiales bacterium]